MNVVFIVTDNQSPWTLGCYGNDEIRTPNLDRLAGEGLKFDNAFCVNPVCSPNRATMLTGLMPSQHGVHSWLGLEKPDSQMGADAYSTIGEFSSLPQLLAERGYDCGLSGKWHLGDSLHPQLGFRYWFTKPGGHTGTFYDAEMIWDEEVYREPAYATTAISDHAVRFLEEERTQPFFLYIGYNGPYGLDRDMREGHRNRHAAYYADKELTCFPREEMHPWQVHYQDCLNNETVRRSYAAAVSGIDDGVGTVLSALERLDLVEDTLVVFTSDHGLCGGHNGFWGMGDHSDPHHLVQTNMRVPLLVRHPSSDRATGSLDLLTCNYDLWASLIELLDLPQEQKDGHARPGRSYASAILSERLDWGEEILFHDYEGVRGVQTRDWKWIRRHPSGPNELYHIGNDPWERDNCAEEAAHRDTRDTMDARLQDFFSKYTDARYDVWKEGISKAS